MEPVDKKIWWSYLGEDLQELLGEALLLSDIVGKWETKFHDYAFIVFPAAKAYEGFLKKLFLDLGLISSKEYYGRHFRIGKALNPSLEQNLRKEESVYDKLVEYCQGKVLADKLWNTWKLARNLIFHWFPDEKNVITYEDAEVRVNMVIEAIDAAFTECKIKKGNAQERSSS